MKIIYKNGQTNIIFSPRNGADSSLTMQLGWMRVPQISEQDYLSQGDNENGIEAILDVREAVVRMFRYHCLSSNGSLGTTHGCLTFWVEDVTSNDDESISVTVDFLVYNGAYNAMGAGTGYKIPDGLPEIESIKSTLGIFQGKWALERYLLTRHRAGKSADLPDWPLSMDPYRIQDWISRSYELQSNPLPALRKRFPQTDFSYGTMAVWEDSDPMKIRMDFPRYIQKPSCEEGFQAIIPVWGKDRWNSGDNLGYCVFIEGDCN